MAQQTAAGQLIGRRLGEFVLREQIGAGGFGAVFRAQQDLLDREAVIKVSLRDASERPDQVANFLHEAKLASRIDHPFAAHVYAFGAEPDGTRWIAMELVRGTSLADMLEQGRLPVQRAIPLLVRLCEVVHTVHEQGIVHRDIKPNNVMVIARSGAMFPKLLDLGVASELAQTFLAGEGKAVASTNSSLAGTPLYMAPEQWVPGAPVTAATDVYALGVLAYELLTGKPPFLGNTAMELAAKHARTVPPRLPDEFASGLADAIAKALTKRPKERFATALEFGAALRDASGLSLDVVDLPSLDPITRDEIFTGAPQPIAESVVAMEAARTPHQLRAAIWRVTTVLAQYVGNLALALRQRAVGRQGDAPAVTELLQQLSTGMLDAPGWWKLTRELVRPFADKPMLYPVPELVEAFFEGGAELKNAVDALIASRSSDPGDKASADDVRPYLVGAMAILTRALRSLRFLHEYRLGVIRGDVVEAWMGLRRPLRLQQAVLAGAGAEGPALFDRDGVVVTSLASVASCDEPNPGAPEELFFLVGAVRGSARMMALPGALEKRREDVWALHHIVVGGDAAATTQLSREEQAPYLGLQTFSAADANLYFGRESEVLGFVNRMSGRRFIAVVGPSGSGKSSFIQAGVLPNLMDHRTVLVLRPGAAPLESLVHACKTLGIELTSEQLRASPKALAHAVQGRLAQGDGGGAVLPPLFLVVDQFEELVTMCLDEAVQLTFAEALIELSTTEALSASVVITLRDDFLIRITQVPALRDRMSSSLHLVTTPIEEDLRRILTEPARRSGYEFEDAALVTEIAKEVAHQSAALALLSFTAYQLWQFRDKHFRRLTRKAYQALGGVGGALAHHAESVLGAMSEAEQRAVREVFRHLVTADGTRASLSRPELLQVAGGEAAAPVLERLIGARLLVAQEGADAQERIEVIHEALLAAWPRLVRWRHEDAEGARLRDQLRVAAKQWNERGKDKGLLWRGDTLTEYRLWRARYPGSITTLEEAFATASLAHAQRLKRRWQVFATVVLTVLVITSIVFARLRIVAEQSRAQAARQLTESYVEQGRRSMLENDPATSLLYLREALARKSPDAALPFLLAQALTPLRAEVGTLAMPAARIWRLRVSPNAQRLLVATGDGSIGIWNLASLVRERSLTAHAAGRLDAVWIDDATIASFGADGIMATWNANDGSRLAHAAIEHAGARTIDWNAAARELVVVTTQATVFAWDVDHNTTRLLRDTAGVTRLAFLAAVARRSDAVALFGGRGDGSPAFSELHLGARVVQLPAVDSGVVEASFSPDETRFAAAMLNGCTQIWRADNGAASKRFCGHEGEVKRLAWNADGSKLATGGVDKAIRVWDIETGANRVLSGHTADITNVEFSATGRYLYSTSNDGTIKLWELERGILVATMLHGGLVRSFAVVPSTDTFVSASMVGLVKVWQVEPETWFRVYDQVVNNDPYEKKPVVSSRGQLIRATENGLAVWNIATGERIALPDNAAVTVGFSLFDAATKVAAVSKDGIVRTYDLLAAGLISSQPLLQGASVVMVAASPDASTTIVSDDQRFVHWLNQAGKVYRSPQFAEMVTGAQWAADGQTLVLALGEDEDKHQIVIDVASGRQLTQLPGLWLNVVPSPRGDLLLGQAIANSVATVFSRDGDEITKLPHAGNVRAIAFSPDGTQALIGVEDGTVSIWNVADWTVAGVLTGHRTNVDEIAFSPDGNLVFCLNLDGDVFVWDFRRLRNLSRVRVAKDSLWIVPDPTNQFLITVSLSGHTDARAIAGLGAVPMQDDLIRKFVCRIPHALREQTPSTVVCAGDVPGT